MMSTHIAATHHLDAYVRAFVCLLQVEKSENERNDDGIGGRETDSKRMVEESEGIDGGERRWSIDSELLLCVCYVNRSLVTDLPCRAGQPLC